MYRFFVEQNQILVENHRAVIIGEDVNHIKNVLRMKPGEEISLVVSGCDKEYRCGISQYTEDVVECELLFIKDSNSELPCEVTLYQALPKSDKMELIIQKAVELGVSRIVPVATKRAVVKLDNTKEEKKIARWNAISEAAAKQSKRGVIPKVSSVMTFAKAVEDAKSCECRLIPYELSDSGGMDTTRKLIGSIKPGDRVAIFIGPEGGFADEEIEIARKAEVEPITLGRRILRTETAGMVVLSWLGFVLE